MITKNEEESIMEDAIGSKISDYLIKPVNPNQILLSIKKNLNITDLISSKTVSMYNQGFRDIYSLINQNLDFNGWIELYKKIVFWELELIETNNLELINTLYDQYDKANDLFFKYIKLNYEGWFKGQDSPVMSHNIFKRLISPLIKDSEDLFVIVVDNLRYDQWKLIEKYIAEDFNIKEDLYFSILPTSTEFSRNSFFAGLTPLEISQKFPQFWSPDDTKSKNKFESDLLKNQL
ncbi:MAG: two-component system response regulator, partial [Flavobacteriales bacterium]|nr:two-component system response regulator [Flavobacteriales bacterium]